MVMVWISSAIAVVVAVVIGFAIYFDSQDGDRFANQCKARHGVVKTVQGYRSSTDYCVTDHGIVDVR